VIYIEAVHMSGGTKHEHIAEVKWRDPSNNATDCWSRARMVDWINDGGQAYVKDGSDRGLVAVVNASPPYIRTKADDVWTDNLLALPRY
jgi:hypothetical protein